MATLQDNIKTLLDLQDMDTRMEMIRKEHEETPRRIAELEALKANQEQLLEGARAEQSELETRRLSLQKDIDESERRARRSQNRLGEITNTRQHKALLKEIEDLKLLKQDNEEALLEVMESLEGVTSRVEAGTQATSESEAELSELKSGVEPRMAELAEELDKLGKQRAELTSALPFDLLNQYEFIRSRLEDSAVAPVIDGTCQICHMNLTPQQFIELRRLERLMNCPNCQRIIYWAESD